MVPSPSLDRSVKTRLGEQGIRYTPARRAVVAALSRTDGPKSAAELHAEIGSEVPLSSLYRSLSTLETADVVMPHFVARGLTRYELAEWLKGHHHHLICIECGAVEDITVPHSLETQVRRLVERIGSSAGFEPINHTLEIEGRCARCH